MPTEDVCSTRMSSGSKELNTITRRRARVTATFSRRSPPDRFRGPKFNGSTPFASTEKPVEKMITSRSSPWTFSRFFTNKPVVLLREGLAETGDLAVPQHRLDQTPLLDVERHHADRAFPLLPAPQHLLDHRGRLDRVGPQQSLLGPPGPAAQEGPVAPG